MTYRSRSTRQKFYNSLVFLNGVKMVDQEQYILEIFKTRGAFEKDDFYCAFLAFLNSHFFGIPERRVNGRSGAICFGGFIDRMYIRKRWLFMCS